MAYLLNDAQEDTHSIITNFVYRASTAFKWSIDKSLVYLSFIIIIKQYWNDDRSDFNTGIVSRVISIHQVTVVESTNYKLSKLR